MQTGTEPRQFQLSQNHETTPAKHKFFVPLALLHSLVTELRSGCNSKQVIRGPALIHESWSQHANGLIQEVEYYL